MPEKKDMKTLGEKIAEIRKQKGLSQESLAESAKVNLRTVQRIENNETEPRGTTLSLLCAVLNVNVEDIFEYGQKEDKSYLRFFHLSVLSFLLIPMGNIIVPSILWQIKKDRILSLHERAINLINFQITWTALYGILIFMGLLFKIMHYPAAPYFIYAGLAVYMSNLIFPLVFAYRLKKGIEPDFYPKLLPLLK